ncbi:hypothetical protein BOTCAL_0357g00020 [Botryotinia calthae]|uniref:Uncharacterized protein n=1 Tax=Botryotinia calthae TaxID=38488 RepID=A0A4Y8CUM2_9HELO|nr:hypothetical protein BOTCAL_0357g00020 [Botryotinia calthae]
MVTKKISGGLDITPETPSSSLTLLMLTWYNIDIYHSVELIDKDFIRISMIRKAAGPDEVASSIFDHSQAFPSCAEAWEIGGEAVGLIDNLSIGLAAHTSRQDNCHKD